MGYTSDSDAARVAWVTGASRGIGRGVARALGQAGWIVYLTARSSAAGRTGELPGTVEETAGLVTSGGGRGVPIPCDHRDDAAVAAVARRIRDEQGRLDLLVNSAWAGYERLSPQTYQQWTAPMWQQPLELFDAMFDGGVRAHYAAIVMCAPLLIATPGSLIVTLSVAVPEAEQEAFGVAYSMAKVADDRLAFAAAEQLRALGVTSVSLHPDWVRTENVLRFAGHIDFEGSQSPAGVGRAVCALAADPQALSLTGQALTVEELAARYNVDVTS
jgi:NAD(P)-dependent dehydrogenase (short-subunit alcohol dehydrogenase family)